MTYYGDGFAAEELRNYSVCVKEGKSIRNLVKSEELTTQLLVFVDQVFPTYEKYGEQFIEKGELVRYAHVNVGYR